MKMMVLSANTKFLVSAARTGHLALHDARNNIQPKENLIHSTVKANRVYLSAAPILYSYLIIAYTPF